MTASFSDEPDGKLVSRLVQTLWSWELCTDCRKGQLCSSRECPGCRIPHLKRYLQYYRAIIATYLERGSTTRRLIETHESLFEVILILKSHPNATRAEISQLAFPAADTQSGRSDDTDALALVVKVLLMIDPSALHHSSDRLEKGAFRIHWKSDVPCSKFVQDIFPIGNHPVLSYANSELFVHMKSELQAINLKKRLGIIVTATSDIQNHLHFDRRRNVLEVFHYTAFLKEQLRVTRNASDCSSTPLSIERYVTS